jgi:hypothetical protein
MLTLAVPAVLTRYLARVDADPEAGEAHRAAVGAVVEAMNRYLGVAVGEHLGYLLTGAWTALMGVALPPDGGRPGMARRRRPAHRPGADAARSSSWAVKRRPAGSSPSA